MTRALLVAALLSMSAAASANVWQDASTGKVEPSMDSYDQVMSLADDAVHQALSAGLSRDQLEKQVGSATKLYRAAASLDPKAGEPYYRIGQLLYAMYFADCNQGGGTSPLCRGRTDVEGLQTIPAYRQRADEMLAAWDAFEARAPLDPRLSREFLFQRAILRTKMATMDSWAGAARDYEAILARVEERGADVSTTEGNLAETYMMMGRLDDALGMYVAAIRDGGTDAYWGYVVCLDRDEQESRAKQLITDAGMERWQAFQRQVRSGHWFFVPSGEKFYYAALAEEAFGDFDAAAADWGHFLESGAHKQFQPRAKAHLAKLKSGHPASKSMPEDDDSIYP